MMARMDLAEFLTARIAENEADARTDSGEITPIDAWPPARVLAECEAKRRIVNLHRPVVKRATGASSGEVQDCAICDHFPAQYPCSTLRALALPYVDHPDYRDEWR